MSDPRPGIEVDRENESLTFGSQDDLRHRSLIGAQGRHHRTRDWTGCLGGGNYVSPSGEVQNPIGLINAQHAENEGVFPIRTRRLALRTALLAMISSGHQSRAVGYQLSFGAESPSG